MNVLFGRSCLLCGAVGVLRATLRFGAVRTMRACTHALRMPNAKEVFFVGLMGFPPTHPRVKN